MKELIFKLASTSRHAKVSFLILLDLCIFPILLWLSYAIRQFDLGVEVIPHLDYGIFIVTALSVLSLWITGVYRFILRAFNEYFVLCLLIAVIIMVAVLYALAYFTHAFIPTSIPLMFGFLMFCWVWFSRAAIRFVVKAAFHSEQSRKRIAIYGAGYAG